MVKMVEVEEVVVVMAVVCEVDIDTTDLLLAVPLHRRQEALPDIGVQEELFQVKDEGLLHEDEVIFGDAEGVVVGWTQLPLAGYIGHHTCLFHRRHLLTCQRFTEINKRKA